MRLLHYAHDIHECLIRVAMMLLGTLWSGNIKSMVNFEGLVLLGPLDAEVLVINFYCRLYHANCISDSSTLMLRGLLTLELGLQLNWHREWILK